MSNAVDAVLTNEQLKLDACRRQLGTALHLFMHDLDPVSVHCLACGGAELADELATLKGVDSFRKHAQSTYPELAVRDLARLRNRAWNAMKHVKHVDGEVRDDAIILSEFNDQLNEHTLFVGWHDLRQLVACSPLEAQAFQVWYFARNVGRLAPEVDTTPYITFFPRAGNVDRGEAKRMLRLAIDAHRARPDIMNHLETERLPLVLPRSP